MNLQEAFVQAGIAQPPPQEPVEHPVTLDQLLKSLTPDQIESRLQTGLAQIQPEHNYESQPARMGFLPTAGQPLVVMNGEFRAIRAESSIDLAKGMASGNRKLLDLQFINRNQRREITNILATRLSTSSRSESPAIPPPPAPRKPSERPDVPESVMETVVEIIHEVQKLNLPPDLHNSLIEAAGRVAIESREAALDMVREVEMTLYTAIYDNLEDRIVLQCGTSQEAAKRLKSLLEGPNAMMPAPKGRPASGKYRYKTVKP